MIYIQASYDDISVDKNADANTLPLFNNCCSYRL